MERNHSMEEPIANKFSVCERHHQSTEAEQPALQRNGHTFLFLEAKQLYDNTTYLFLLYNTSSMPLKLGFNFIISFFASHVLSYRAVV
jgi:hypothetical protein